MKALTLWEPWASAIVYGKKRIENRVWKPPATIRGKRIAIHAGRALDKQAAAVLASAGMFDFDAVEHRPGFVLGTAVVVGMAHRPDDMFDARTVYQFFDVDHHTYGIEFCRRACDEMTFKERWLMDDQYGWLLQGVRALPEPFEVRGYQGIWNLNLSVTECCGVVVPTKAECGSSWFECVCGKQRRTE